MINQQSKLWIITPLLLGALAIGCNKKRKPVQIDQNKKTETNASDTEGSRYTPPASSTYTPREADPVGSTEDETDTTVDPSASETAATDDETETETETETTEEDSQTSNSGSRNSDSRDNKVRTQSNTSSDQKNSSDPEDTEFYKNCEDDWDKEQNERSQLLYH